MINPASGILNCGKIFQILAKINSDSKQFMLFCSNIFNPVSLNKSLKEVEEKAAIIIQAYLSGTKCIFPSHSVSQSEIFMEIRKEKEKKKKNSRYCVN